MTVNGQPVTPVISGTARDFKLIYDTEGSYDFGSAVQVTVEADDYCAPPLELSAIYTFSVTGQADADDDGLPDGWETAHGLDPHQGDGRYGADGDMDGDGDSNLQEYQDGRDPTSPAAVITGPGFGPANDALVRVFDAEGHLLETTGFLAYAGMSGYGLNVAGADVDADPADEILTGPGPGHQNSPQVRAFDSGGNEVAGVNFLAYGIMKYGVNVAGGRVAAGARDIILTGAGPGSVFGPHVRGWSCETGNALPVKGINYFAYGTRKYGVRVGRGDVDGDGLDEILTGAGPGPVFGPHVRSWNYNGQTVTPVQNGGFFAYATKKWGVGVSSGDLDRDGLDEILTGAGPGPVFGPHVRAWDFFAGGGISAVKGVSFFAYGTRKYGVTVAGGDFDADGCDEIITGPGPGEMFGPQVRGWNYDGELLTLTTLNFFAYDRQAYRYGVSVAAARTDF
jgi:hypothetical protein